ncbi:MAG: alpha/beta hydrolase [Alphaproteobacteria bacterium]|nr:alpha/beta hydrolase [Alphaproteobacteria bacterium]MBU0797060.1 alpha/beta hydrolase [Alphaproteobacteria bacterium]MBU0887868.1 alpha/beta hydrolase [Alphaproteobacteria bacterium]MBU1814909.1 alpha/beta hydrolase [Alphaproteobacteria bacterium]
MSVLLLARAIKLTAIPVLLASLLSGCSGLATLNAALLAQDYPVTADIAYGPDPRHRLDVHRPAGDALHPVVVFFYGGGWKNGARGDYKFVAEALVKRGYVVVIPDYRVYPAVRFPVFIEDGAKAVRWVHENIRQHGGDPERLYLGGHSAGAHLGAMLALDRHYLQAEGLETTDIKGFFGLAGPYALDPTEYRSTRDIFATAKTRAETQPVEFVTDKAPPMLLLHGTGDGTVYPVNSQKLAAALRAHDVPVRHVEYPDTGHISILLAFYPALAGALPVIEDVTSALRDFEAGTLR